MTSTMMFTDMYLLNGDIAGLCARTDSVADAWFSPGGFNRGQIRGAVKLAFNPNQTQRDELYKSRVNPCVSFPGQGTVLFGDKTAQSNQVRLIESMFVDCSLFLKKHVLRLLNFNYLNSMMNSLGRTLET